MREPSCPTFPTLSDSQLASTQGGKPAGSSKPAPKGGGKGGPVDVTTTISDNKGNGNGNQTQLRGNQTRGKLVIE
jgi:hypothetical protein